MADIPQPIEIPNRALFKAAEVCDLAKVQPYVLRSWEAEFKDLGVSKNGSSTRVYRREDVERVLRIKHLLLIEGLTLAGVRRRLEEETEPPLDEESVGVGPTAVTLAADAREKIGDVKRGLRSLLALLDAPVGTANDAASSSAASEFALAPPSTSEEPVGESGNGRATKDDGPKAASPRRKRSA
jgi:DNA-binding transcriptional MerR regulator